MCIKSDTVLVVIILGVVQFHSSWERSLVGYQMVKCLLMWCHQILTASRTLTLWSLPLSFLFDMLPPYNSDIKRNCFRWHYPIKYFQSSFCNLSWVVRFDNIWINISVHFLAFFCRWVHATLFWVHSAEESWHVFIYKFWHGQIGTSLIFSSLS